MVDEARVNACLALLCKKRDVPDSKQVRYYQKEDTYLPEWASVAGEDVPLFYWRETPAIVKVAGYNRRIGEVVSCKIAAYCPRNVSLSELMFREYDISEWFLDGCIKHTMGFINGPTANILARMDNGRLATLELAATMPEDATPQGKRALYGREGFAADTVVANHIKPEAIYLFTDSKNPTTYTDCAIDLYGYTEEEIIRAGLLFEMLTGKIEYSGWCARYSRLTTLVEKTYQAAACGGRVYAEV